MFDFQQVAVDVRGRVKVCENEIIFVDAGVKINGTYCCDVLLTEQLLPVMREITGEFFIFQQDSAPAHRACETINLVEWETSVFISPNRWIPIVQSDHGWL